MTADRLWVPIAAKHHKEGFLSKIHSGDSIRILDVGCGNNGVSKVRRFCRNGDQIFYSGLDVGDYNITNDSKNDADEYVIISPEGFADAILRWEGKEDYVISSHNLEHCNDPSKVLDNIIRSLKPGGMLYLSFPSEESTEFPRGFAGCLNFYDDLTHQNVPSWKDTLSRLEEDGMEIVYSCKNYRPLLLRIAGMLSWPIVKRRKKVIHGT